MIKMPLKVFVELSDNIYEQVEQYSISRHGRTDFQGRFPPKPVRLCV